MKHDKLKLEDYCLTVEQAKELKKLGIDMDNPLFEYIQLVNDKQYIEEAVEKRVLGKPFLYNNTLSTLVVGGNEMYELVTPTLTNTEMLKMLPHSIESSMLEIHYWSGWNIRYYGIIEVQDSSLRDVLFEIIKYLKTNKLM